MLNPDRLFRRTWDFAQLLLLVYICAAVPLRVGFDRPTYGGWFITDLLVDLFFIIDIGLNFITAYQDDDGDLSTDLRDISRHYVRTWLALDIVAAFPVDYIIRGVEGELGCSFTSCPRTDIAQAGTMQPRLLKLFRVLRITRLFKLLRIARITKLLEKYQAIFFVILPVSDPCLLSCPLRQAPSLESLSSQQALAALQCGSPPYLPLLTPLQAISIARQIIVLGFLGHLLGCFFYYFSTSTWRSVTEQRLIEEGILSNWIIYEFHGEEYE